MIHLFTICPPPITFPIHRLFIPQALFWFAVVYIAEAIVTWVYHLPGFWCQDFNYNMTDVTGALQRIADMV